MAKRKLYKDRYQKAIDHIIAKTCLKDAKQSKNKVALNSYFNHIDFVLESIFGIKVVLP